MTKAKSIAILITVFNRKETTLKCLRALNEQEGNAEYSIDTYVVDGGSTDGTPDAIRSHFPNVHVEVRQGYFWNRGMHSAWEMASRTKEYDFFLWLNDDTTLRHDAIRMLIEAARDTDDKAIIVGGTVDTATHRCHTYGGRSSGGMLVPLDGRLSRVHHFNGNVVLVPRSVYEAIGNLDPYFAHSKGDFDYGMRAARAGFAAYQVGTPVGACDVHPSLDRWCNPSVSFTERWKAMHQPNGMPPNETFHYEKRHFGWMTATWHVFTIHVRCLFPKLWL